MFDVRRKTNDVDDGGECAADGWDEGVDEDEGEDVSREVERSPDVTENDCVRCESGKVEKEDENFADRCWVVHFESITLTILEVFVM